ncbi:murein hydrolase activator EnvC family protein [Legionella waltersii]|uniref:Peptidase, M23/M37 family n=1 Tax=Legionella waltersii TaxID=66969 RepID=A0A0W1A3L0_9GAMM|nr:peptidoglycan DD-metalloendopeptidase family protein [Legionella waltersii]KTD75587.1 peptidase, M23/M37 family [Legionella waltersii]SNU98887.1 peptidase, M23/M37 family [Legionella waltersii]
MRLPNLIDKNTLKHTALGLMIGTILPVNLEAQPNQSSVTTTQNKIKQLDTQISNLKSTLAHATDRQGVLNKELSQTEKQIGDGVRKLSTIQNNIAIKEKTISDLQSKVTDLNKVLFTHQALLANQVQARYQMGEYQPLKWIINQDDPFKISRVLTYYQYMIKSREQLIEQIQTTTNEINANKDKLHKELSETQQLKFRLVQNQQQLEQHKQYHQALIHSLDNDIQNKKHTLQEFQKNKDNLSQLLKSLSQQSAMKNSKPFNQMHKKLPLPIHSTHRSLHRMNQGVTIFADEGSVVSAVYPGKVVFSDWLNGYGLLIIIDHGQGFMTLYAHNQSLFKQKGQFVQQNEQIATVGHTGGIKQNGLYFEIRQKGKAVNPLNWLS